MKELIKGAVINHHKQTNGKCGLSVVKLSQQLKTPISGLRDALNELHTEKFIEVREGINNKLIFKNDK